MPYRVFLGVRFLSGAYRSDIEAKQFLFRIAEHLAGLFIDIYDLAGFDIMHKYPVISRIKYSGIINLF